MQKIKGSFLALFFILILIPKFEVSILKALDLKGEERSPHIQKMCAKLNPGIRG